MTTPSVPVITIDGPSGSGKGTIAAMLARQHGWHLLDSGALYRLLGLTAHEQGLLDAPDAATLAQAATGLDIAFCTDAERRLSIWLSGRDVTDTIRTETVGGYASQVAAYPQVRQALLAWQRQCARAPGLVADGRDMGTVVFPDAAVKIYLTASSQSRAQRRFLQLKNMGVNASLEHILADLQARDHRDTSRAAAPLKPAPDALCIDSSDMDIESVLDMIGRHIAQTLPSLGAKSP